MFKKNSLKYLVLFSFIAMNLLVGCKKDNPDNPDDPAPKEVTGKIVLPEGSTTDVNSLTVLSTSAQSPVSDGSFDVEVFGDYTSLYATNANDEVLLIGYKYPGSTSNDITPTTTALGLLMMSPAVLELSEQGKQTMINNLLSDNNFTTLVNEIEQAQIQGRSLFDTTNTTLITAMDDLFQSVVFRRSSLSSSLPVEMTNSGRNFSFSNKNIFPGVSTSFSTVIGIYKDANNQPEETLIVKGENVVPTSYTELVQGIGNVLGDPISETQNYTLSGDGDFTFKFRTGKPGFGDGSPEHDEAFYENLAEFTVHFLSTVLPNLKANGNTACFTKIKASAISTLNTASSIDLNSNAAIPAILVAVKEIALNLIGSLVECSSAVIEQGWLSAITKHLNFIAKYTNGANTGIFAVHWAFADAVADTCFSVSGNSVTNDCGGCSNPCNGLTSFSDPRDGKTYQLVEIGCQCWMAENLNYQISNSRCYDNNSSNCNTYGMLYSWQLAISACPQGWHVPNDLEWSEMVDFLGGFNDAGGKLKDDANWDGDNNSGWSGLPGGGRYSNGTFLHLGNLGNWWSSSDFGSTAGHIKLDDGTDVVTIDSRDKTFLYSCRCMLD